MGKTCLVSRYVKNQLPRKVEPTIGVEFATKNVIMKDGATVKAQIWDTAGQEKYRAITVAHYRKALGALIVYDITRRQTFENVKFWLDSLLAQSESNISLMLVGNKLDLVEEEPKKRQVSVVEAQEYCMQHKNMHFIETSTVQRTNVNDAFEMLLQDIYEKRMRLPSNFNRDPVIVFSNNDGPRT